MSQNAAIEIIKISLLHIRYSPNCSLNIEKLDFKGLFFSCKELFKFMKKHFPQYVSVKADFRIEIPKNIHPENSLIIPIKDEFVVKNVKVKKLLINKPLSLEFINCQIEEIKYDVFQGDARRSCFIVHSLPDGLKKFSSNISELMFNFSPEALKKCKFLECIQVKCKYVYFENIYFPNLKVLEISCTNYYNLDISSVLGSWLEKLIVDSIAIDELPGTLKYLKVNELIINFPEDFFPCPELETLIVEEDNAYFCDKDPDNYKNTDTGEKIIQIFPDLPPMLKFLKLSLGYFYNFNYLPDSLTHIKLLEGFDQQIDYWPTNLKVLKLGGCFNQHLIGLPEGLKKLVLDASSSYSYDYTLNLPENLKILKIKRRLKSKLGKLPPALEVLYLCEKYDHPIDNLPESLTEIYLHEEIKINCNLSEKLKNCLKIIGD